MVTVVKKPIRGAGWSPTQLMYYGDYAQFLHLALNNPDKEIACPDMPTIPCGADHEQEAILYWEGALYLMVYLLGWSNPAKGLHWAYTTGAAVQDDPVINLLRSIYDNNGQLAMLAAWYWDKRAIAGREIRNWAHGATEGWSWSDETHFDPGSAWRQKFDRDYQSGRWQGWLPYSSDYTPLHLGHILSVGSRSQTEWIVGEKHTRRAVLLVHGVSGNWYHALCESGQELPDLGDHSWRVDVVHRQVGWLGAFRRSRATGLWFQGKHSVHEQGN